MGMGFGIRDSGFGKAGRGKTCRSNASAFAFSDLESQIPNPRFTSDPESRIPNPGAPRGRP
jgi:hypothetical protein